MQWWTLMIAITALYAVLKISQYLNTNAYEIRTCTCHGKHIYDVQQQNGYSLETGNKIYHI